MNSETVNQGQPLAHIRPKAFISYAWTNLEFKDLVKEWVMRLLSDGVDVLFDQYTLKEGHDLNHYMEKMVADPSVTHVIIFCNAEYASKADSRSGGVGTESQIISNETYAKMEQNKFIPVVCEFNESGEAILPVFLKGKVWINFSNEEHINNNWEQLIRTLWNRPAFEKPEVGQPPAYITDPQTYRVNKAIAAFRDLESAILADKKSAPLLREKFIGACVLQADELRVRKAPDLGKLSHQIVEDFKKLSEINKLIAEWVTLETRVTTNGACLRHIKSLLERLLALKGPPSDFGGYNEAWFDAYSLFTYECFMYVVAALIKTGDYESLKGVIHNHYLPPKSWANQNKLERFDAFYAHTSAITEALTETDPQKRRFNNQPAELLKRSANSQHICFHDVCEADALLFIVGTACGIRWYPQTSYYWSMGSTSRFSLFLRASQKSEFKLLAAVFDVTSGEELRRRLNERGESALGPGTNYMSSPSFNIQNLDTL